MSNTLGKIAAGRKKVAVMPLAVLLPSLGDLTKLAAIGEELHDRLEELQSDKDQGTEEDVRKRFGEEGMLVQVLQWLAVDRKEGGA